jgi:hypothetical protein
MNFFNFFKKKETLKNDDLIPFLTKEIKNSLIVDFEEGPTNFFEINYYENENSPYKEKAVGYWVENNLCFLDQRNKATYGWIMIDENFAESVKVYLVKHQLNSNNYQVLFHFTFLEEQVIDPTFGHVNIIDIDKGLSQCFRHIQSTASFFAFEQPPPFVAFAKLISM